MNAKKNDAKRVFLKKGTCSQTLCFLLDREFGHAQAAVERAADPLAGGVMNGGQQCGMLWGATLAAGAESFRRHADRDQAVGAAISASRQLVASFEKRAKSVNCREIMGCDFTRKSGLWKALLLGRFVRCFRLAGHWAPEAIRAAQNGLAAGPEVSSRPLPSCAAAVVKKMGAGDEEAVMVAGFAGGIGLSGNGCGALAAAIWMKTLAWSREHPGQALSYFKNPLAIELLKTFAAETGGKMTCLEITGRRFMSADEHGEFLAGGGCAGLLERLAGT